MQYRPLEDDKGRYDPAACLIQPGTSGGQYIIDCSRHRIIDTKPSSAKAKYKRSHFIRTFPKILRYQLRNLRQAEAGEKQRSNEKDGLRLLELSGMFQNERRKVMEEAYLGMIIGFGGNFAPQNWALCDGSLVSISGHEALFSLLGTTFGGDGYNNFALPNLMHRVPIGSGQGPGLTNRVLGQTGGAADVTLNVANFPAHTHNFNVSKAVGNQTSPASGCTLSALDQTSITFYDTFAEATLAALNTAAVSTANGGAPHNNVMPYEEITYIIHLTGTYPQFP